MKTIEQLTAEYEAASAALIAANHALDAATNAANETRLAACAASAELRFSEWIRDNHGFIDPRWPSIPTARSIVSIDGQWVTLAGCEHAGRYGRMGEPRATAPIVVNATTGHLKGNRDRNATPLSPELLAAEIAAFKARQKGNP